MVKSIFTFEELLSRQLSGDPIQHDEEAKLVSELKPGDHIWQAVTPSAFSEISLWEKGPDKCFFVAERDVVGVTETSPNMFSIILKGESDLLDCFSSLEGQGNGNMMKCKANCIAGATFSTSFEQMLPILMKEARDWNNSMLRAANKHLVAAKMHTKQLDRCLSGMTTLTGF